MICSQPEPRVYRMLWCKDRLQDWCLAECRQHESLMCSFSTICAGPAGTYLGNLNVDSFRDLPLQQDSSCTAE